MLNRQISRLLIPISVLIVVISACGQNCSQCGGNNDLCFACDPGYQLSVLSKCNPETLIEKCSLYGPTGQCFVCQPTFTLANGKCVKDFSGCLNAGDNSCKQCGFGTLLEAGKCMGTLNCLNAEKSCSKCASGFTLKNGKCYPGQECKLFDETIGVCKQCSPGYDMIGYRCIFSAKRVYDCYIYNDNFECETCKYGFIPFQKQCLVPTQIQSVQSGQKTLTQIISQKKVKFQKYIAQSIKTDQANTITSPQIFKIDNCKIVDQKNKICALCEDRFYRSASSCLMVNENCKDYDMTNGKCMSCTGSLIMVNGECVKKQVDTVTQTPTKTTPVQGGGAVVINNNNQPSSTASTTTTKSNTPTSSAPAVQDPNCLKWQSNKCTKCSDRFYMSQIDNKCIPINPLCDTYNQKGACLTCFKGYQILGDNCVVAKEKDPNCKVEKNGICTTCYDGYYYNQLQMSCQPLNPLCKTSDTSNGRCTTCYQGFTLSEGICKVFVRDPNCQQYDSSNQCKKCSDRFYNSLGTCKLVSPLCKNYDRVIGLCTQCYPGYVLTNGICAIANSKNEDLSCKQKKNNICTECYSGYYLNSKTNICTVQNILCKTINKENGNCITCYDGYVIDDNTCAIASEQTADVHCKKSQNGNKKKCAQCYQGYYIDSVAGLCTAFDPTCKEADMKTGACKSCYNGYVLENGKCNANTPLPGQNADPYCIKLEGNTCIQCNKGYFVASNNVCTQVDVLCKTYSKDNGYCASCYSGYFLFNYKCVSAQDLYIPFCKIVGQNGKCAECQDRYYLSNDACQPVSLLCNTFNKSTGKCITCTPGYFFQNDECIYPALGIDPACTFYTNSYCSQCKPGYFLQNYFCTQIDSKCLDFDYSKNNCKKCYNSNPQGPYCV